MKFIANTDLDGTQYLEFELRPCKIFDEGRHINQTCHNKFDNCWRNAYTEKRAEDAIAQTIKIYPKMKVKVTGVSFASSKT